MGGTGDSRGSSGGLCFQVQAINQYPDNISGTTDGVNYCKNGASCVDINSDSIVAQSVSGTAAPIKTLVHISGCGGNCNAAGCGDATTCPSTDCVNGCSQTSTLDPCASALSLGVSPSCNSMYYLKNNAWALTSTNYANYMQNSAMLGVDPFAATLGDPKCNTNYEREGNNVAAGCTVTWKNWCSGAYMHFDFGASDLFQDTIGTDTTTLINDGKLAAYCLSRDTSGKCTSADYDKPIVRYRQVECPPNIYSS
jgi:hypothetical protein